MDKKTIATQLETASQVIQYVDGAELYTSILDVCGGLLHLVSTGLDSKDVNDESLKDIDASMKYIGSNLKAITNTVVNSDTLKVSTDSIDGLTKAISEHSGLLAREEDARKELLSISSAIEHLKPTVEALETNYKSQCAQKESLEKSLSEFSEEKINELVDKNNLLINELVSKQSKYEALVKNNEEYRNKHNDIDRKIADLPTEQQLVLEFDKKQSEYKRLLNAKEECSEEKQLEISEKIAEIEKNVNSLLESMTLLRNRRDELNSAKTKIDTDKGIFETAFIKEIEKNMDDLKNHMRVHRERLNKVKNDSEELKKHIEECDEIYKNYRFMFDTANSPLDAIVKASKIEYAELAKCFDINKSNHVKALKNDIEDKLNELDTIIDECLKAISLDQQSLRNKAFGKE